MIYQTIAVLFFSYLYIQPSSSVYNHRAMSSRSATGYHLQTTGQAAETAAAHAPAQDIAASIHFLGACFCPFVHRSWIALEILNQLIADPSKRKVSKIDYVYDECDPYKKEQRLVEISPKGLVPVRAIGRCKRES